MDEQIGRVVALNRYPVKSLQGEQPEAADFDDLGMVGDRTWALHDVETAKTMTAKREPRLLEAAARWEDGAERPTLTLPDGTVLGPEREGADVDAALSAWLGHAVALRPAPVGPQPGAAYEMSFDVDDEERDVFEVPMRPGRFLDLCPVHVLTTASIAAAAAEHPDGVWDPHRFRPTVLVELDAGDGFVENGWLERHVTIGTLVVRPIMPTIRCVMTTRAQPDHDLARDLGIVKTINRVNGGNLGTYAEIDQPGAVRVGDVVAISAAAAD